MSGARMNFWGGFGGTNIPVAFAATPAVDVRSDYAAHQIGATKYKLATPQAVATTILAPASNVNGLVLRHIQYFVNIYGCAIFADTAAPVSNYDTTKNCIAIFLQNTFSPPIYPHLLVPAGLGLYAWTADTGSVLWLSYDLL